MKGTSRLEPWLFCAPALLAIALVALAPLLQTFYFSFTDARLGFSDSARWTGLANYHFLLKDPEWWRAVLNTVVFCLIAVSLELVFGLMLALLLNLPFRGRAAVRAAVLIPWAIPAVVSARMWAWMFNDLYGVVNHVLLKLGVIDHPWAWLADPALSLFVVVVVDVWKTTPFAALLLLAGLQSIPNSLIEAARVDGISAWKRFTAITLPLLKPAIAVTVIFRSLDTLRIFDLPFVLTSNSKETLVMSVYARQQLIDFQDVGYGSAAAVLIFFVIALIALLYIGINRRSVWGESP
jgi:trehalose/maltose transport system permease protein